MSTTAPTRPTRPTRPLAAALAGAALLTAALGAAPAAATSASSTSASCATAWGSLPERGGVGTTADLVGVRSGQHPCFDRLVLDLGPGRAAGYSVRYVPVVTADGSGAPVPTRGGAALEVVAHAAAYDEQGRPTYRPADPRELAPVAGYRTFRQVAWAGSFEGSTTVALGVRARLPFRVLVVPGPGTGSRLVVDVAHRW